MPTLAEMLQPFARAKGAAKSSGIICNDPEIVALAESWRTAKVAFDAAESSKAIAEASLKPACFPVWIRENHGRANPESSVRIMTPSGKVTCSFQARWNPKGELGPMGVPSKFITRRSSIELNVDEIPEEKKEEVVAALIKVVTDLGCEKAISSKYTEYPNALFEAGRHTLSPETNLAIEMAGLGTVCALRA